MHVQKRLGIIMWAFSRSCHSNNRLVGKTVVITGANTGIGKETARDFYGRGARVILACRDVDKANAAVKEIKSQFVDTGSEKCNNSSQADQAGGGGGQLIVEHLNLTSFQSVRDCARRLSAAESKIDILINNAGVMACPFDKTEDGYESHWQTNHLSHFLLTILLLPAIKRAAPESARIVCVSSKVHIFGDMHFDDLNLEKSYRPLKAYSQSKLANILFAKELARRMKDAQMEGIHTYSLHPGVISTELGRHLDSVTFKGFRVVYRHLSRFFAKTPTQGSQTTIYCAIDDKTKSHTGLYYDNCQVTRPSSKALDQQYAERLWTESLKCVGLPEEEKLDALLASISDIAAR